MKDGEWQQLAAGLVERPEVSIGDPAAVLALSALSQMSRVPIRCAHRSYTS